jgi:signal transduction histidine kinase
MDIILQPFGQADMTLQRNYEGTGLGLPLVNAMVELHGGTLDIFSRDGKGTTATVHFPVDRVMERRQQLAS